MVNPDITEFVDDDRRIRESATCKNFVEQGRFSGAEETRNDTDRNRLHQFTPTGGRKVGRVTLLCAVCAPPSNGFGGVY